MTFMEERWGFSCCVYAVNMLLKAGMLSCGDFLEWLIGVLLGAIFQNLMMNCKCYLWKKNEIIAAENREYQFRIFKGYK